MRLLLLSLFLILTNFANATNPISVEAYEVEISSEESRKKMMKWWNTARAEIKSISKWTLITGLLSGPTLIIGILVDVAAIGYIGIGIMFASLILGCIVLFKKDKSSETYEKSKLRAKLGMGLALLPIAIGLIFVLTFSLG